MRPYYVAEAIAAWVLRGQASLAGASATGLLCGAVTAAQGLGGLFPGGDVGSRRLSVRVCLLQGAAQVGGASGGDAAVCPPVSINSLTARRTPLFRSGPTLPDAAGGAP